jgi:transposase-like protein
MENKALPETLREAIVYFANPETAFNFLVSVRWPKGVVCPRCNGSEPHFITSRNIWRCTACNRQFSVKVGTLFEDSPIGLDLWLPCAAVRQVYCYRHDWGDLHDATETGDG